MIKKIERAISKATVEINLHLTNETKIEEIKGLSSLGVIQFIGNLEDEFGIEIPNTEIKKFKTVGDIVKFLEKNAD